MTTFVFVDPSPSGNPSLKCQICSKIFDSNKSLRHHVTEYQFREQRLLIRLLELQAHLPRNLSLHDAEDTDQTRSSGRACQICFRAFDTDDALHRHITKYKLEQEYLVRTLSCVQVHSTQNKPSRGFPEHVSVMRDVTYLNRLDNNGDDAGCTYDYYGDADGIESEGEDINAAYAPEFGLTNETTRNEASVLCPYRKCRTEQRVFPTRKQILKHLKSHAACLQICAFCGEICTKVSVALSHDCDERQVTNRNDRALTNNWKEVYRSDRREHLTHPEAFLNRTHFGVSIPQNRKRKSNPMHQGHKFSATKRLRTTVTSGVEANNTSAMEVPHRNNISHPSEAQLVQFHLTQTQWEDGETTIKAPQMQAEQATILEDGVRSTHCPIISQPTLGLMDELPEYPPIFEDAAIPPLYSITSLPSMVLTEELPEYPPIFEDATIPPLHSFTSNTHAVSAITLPENPTIFQEPAIPPLYPVISQPNMTLTEEFPEYPPIFEDSTIPPLYPFSLPSDTSCL